MNPRPRLTLSVFAAMVREEWRLHATLFGGRRFALFPGFVATVAAGAVWLLRMTGADLHTVILGTHLLVLAFGLYTGSIGLVSRDALRNLLGDLTLILFSGRTLPLSRRHLLAVFLVKDTVFYAILFLLPLTLAFTPVVLATDIPPIRLSLLWLSLVGMFVLGILLTLVSIALRTHGVSGTAALLAGVVALTWLWLLGVDLLSFTPYALFGEPTTSAAVTGFVALPVLAVVGVVSFEPVASTSARTARNRFESWHDRIPTDRDGLVTKTLLDVSRSSGGLWKVVFSGGLLFVVSIFLIDFATTLTGLAASTGVSFGAILALTAFTTYNWLTQFDAISDYRALPLSTASVLRAKFWGFVVVGIPVALTYYAFALVVRGSPPGEAMVGAVLLVGLSTYLFGLTVFLAGLRPNEFLFDTLLFALFTAAISLPLVPILIVGLVVAPVPPALVIGLTVAGVVLGGIGVGLYRRSIPRWSLRYRQT